MDPMGYAKQKQHISTKNEGRILMNPHNMWGFYIEIGD